MEPDELLNRIYFCNNRKISRSIGGMVSTTIEPKNSGPFSTVDYTIIIIDCVKNK